MKKKNSLGIPDSTIDAIILRPRKDVKTLRSGSGSGMPERQPKRRNNPQHRLYGVTVCHAVFLLLWIFVEFSCQNKAKSERSIVK